MAKKQKDDPIRWTDLWALVEELKKIKRLLSAGHFQAGKDAFNRDVLNVEELSPFDLSSINELLNDSYPVLLRVYTTYENEPHKGGLEFDLELGDDIVKLFTRLGR